MATLFPISPDVASINDGFQKFHQPAQPVPGIVGYQQPAADNTPPNSPLPNTAPRGGIPAYPYGSIPANLPGGSINAPIRNIQMN